MLNETIELERYDRAEISESSWPRWLPPVTYSPEQTDLSDGAAIPLAARPAPHTIERVRSAALMLGDVTAVILSILLASRITALPFAIGGVLVALMVAVIVSHLSGLLDKDSLVLRRSTLDEVPRLFELSAVVGAAYWLTLPSGPGRLPLLILVATVTLTLIVSRHLVRSAVRRALPQRCLFMGDMTALDEVRRKVEGSATNAKIVGALPLENGHTPTNFQGVEGLRRMVAEAGVTRIIVAVSSMSGNALEVVRAAKEAHVPVSIFPRVMKVVGPSVVAEELEGMTLLGVRRFGLNPSSYRIKRMFDLATSAALAVLTLPLFALIALAIKVDTRGPILFRQQRVGRDGEIFEILKFRSMIENADALKQQLRDANETEGLFKIAADPRVTRVGKFLRKTSLDELPQIFNVLRGEMSMVGPRPLVLDEDQQVSGLNRRRLHLTPGMTGPWQVMRSGRVPMQEMVAIDYLYVANWTLWTDIKLLIRTVGYIFARGGV